MNNLNSEFYENEDFLTLSDTSYSEEDALLCEIRNLFLQSQNQNISDLEDYSEPDDADSRITKGDKENLNSTTDLQCAESEKTISLSDCLSPSFSLIQQFEMAAKEEAAITLQSWFKQLRDRRRFLKVRESVILIQQTFRTRQAMLKS